MAYYLVRAKVAQDFMKALVERPEDRLVTTTRLLQGIGGRLHYYFGAALAKRLAWSRMAGCTRGEGGPLEIDLNSNWLVVGALGGLVHRHVTQAVLQVRGREGEVDAPVAVS